jgi:putative flippase GtrA
LTESQRETLRALGFRWIKFNFVGAVGIVVQLAVLALLKSVAGLDYMVATVLAVETAVVHNFAWHERFTWVDRPISDRRAVFNRLVRFNLTTGLLSIGGNLILMHVLVGRMHFHWFVANMLAIATCSVANFLVSHHFVFRPTPEA